MTLLKRILNGVLRDRFSRNVSVLMLGTFGAHLCTAGAMPVLTRLYAPEEFSTLAVYASILSILLTLSTLSLHIAVPIAETNRRAVSLMVLSGIAVLTCSALVGLSAWLGREHVTAVLQRPDFAPYLWLLAPGVLLGGGYAATQLWASRQHEFTLIARTRITRAVAGSATQLGMGFAGAGPVGLIIGHILYNGLGVFLLLRKFWTGQKETLKDLRLADLAGAAHVNRRYLYLTTPASLLNVAAIHMPVIAIATSPAAGEVGHLYMAQLILTLPMMLMGASVGQVFLAEAPARRAEGTLIPFILGVLKGLALTGVPVLALAGILAPLLAAPLLGADWQRTGLLMAWMTPWMIFQFLASPLSTLFYVVERQGLALAIQMVSLTIRYGAVLLALQYAPGISMEIYAVTGAAVYLLTLLLILWTARRDAL